MENDYASELNYVKQEVQEGPRKEIGERIMTIESMKWAVGEYAQSKPGVVNRWRKMEVTLKDKEKGFTASFMAKLPKDTWEQKENDPTCPEGNLWMAFSKASGLTSTILNPDAYMDKLKDNEYKVYIHYGFKTSPDGRPVFSTYKGYATKNIIHIVEKDKKWEEYELYSEAIKKLMDEYNWKDDPTRIQKEDVVYIMNKYR